MAGLDPAIHVFEGKFLRPALECSYYVPYLRGSLLIESPKPELIEQTDDPVPQGPPKR
jgi:hypothetical protein